MKSIPMDQLDEYEQGENVRKWLRKNGSSFITGIALGLACVFAWNWWQSHAAKHKEEAATQYASFLEAIDAKDAAKVKVFANVLADDYADTPYADLAVLRNSAFLYGIGKTDEALQLLKAEAPKIKEPELAEIFKLRITRLLLIAGKTEEARKQIDTVTHPIFPTIADELRGDIAVASGNREDARKYFLAALTNLDQAAPTRRLLEMKLINAGGLPPLAKPEA